MLNTKKTLIAITAMVTLGGCTVTYREALQQKLEGKSPAERRAILAQECGQEIQRGLKPEDDANVGHSKKMKKICEEMTGQEVPVSISGGQESRAGVTK